MPYSYAIAKDVLNENDKNRLMCLYLNCDPSAINWEKATEEFGCASVQSMRVMTRTALKKIEDAGGREGHDAKDPSAMSKSGGKKRKAGAEESAGPKKRGRKPKKADSVVEDDGDEEGSKNVKHEADGDEDEDEI